MIGFRESFETASVEDRLRALTAETFRPGGWLESALGLEHRPQQAQMAEAVAASLAHNRPLLFEAGTGVGKGLAYLLPALYFGLLTGRKAIVSTHTISLQNQLLQKDIPLCRKLFAAVPELADFAAFESALLVGRGNYLCTTRLAKALASHAQELFTTEEERELKRIAAWAEKSADGLRHELHPPPAPEVWEAVNADSSACSRKTCSPEHCFFRKARGQFEKAHLLVVNHSLLFALLAAGEGPRGDTPGILYPNDFLVLDEGHTVPAVATDQLGDRVSSYGLDRLLKRLYHPKTQKGLLRARLTGELHFLAGNAQKSALEAQEAARGFFAGVERSVLTSRDCVRLRSPGWAEHILRKPLRGLCDALGEMAGRMDDGTEKSELEDSKRRLNGYEGALAAALELADEEQVYWAERTGRRRVVVSLQSAPLDVAPLLRRHLFARGTGVVLTSATLADGTDLTPFARKVGAEEVAITGRAGSPFDYEKNVHILVARDAPQPTAQNTRLNADWLADTLAFCVKQVPGGSLVLFTSYADLRAVEPAVRKSCRKDGRALFAQAMDGSRQEIAARFAEAGNAVLLGTDSFWTGVDVPGPALSQVILTRLPFQSPGHPVAEARHEWLSRQGRNPFAEITLPEALLQFRQGLGRLIRSRTDTGLLTLLDSRLLHREYGRRFLDQLPKRHFEVFDQGNRTERFRSTRSE